MTGSDSDAPNSQEKTLSDLEALSALQELLGELIQGPSSPPGESSASPSQEPVPTPDSAVPESQQSENLSLPEESPLPRQISGSATALPPLQDPPKGRDRPSPSGSSDPSSGPMFPPPSCPNLSSDPCS